MRFAARLAVICAFAGPAFASISGTPDQTALWSTFNSVYLRDSFAVVTANDGLAVLRRDAVSGIYSAIRHQFLVAEPVSHKISGDVMLARTVGDLIVFIDVGHLPELTVLGTADVGGEILDYALTGQSLYIARGFDGLWRYQLSDYDNAQFADSSMRGVHVIRCEIDGNELLALDDYNGVLRYRLDGGGFGEFAGYLWVPRQAARFVTRDSLVLTTLQQDQLIYRGVRRETDAVITDSIATFTIPDRLLAYDSLLFTYESLRSIAELIDLTNGTVQPAHIAEAPDPRFQGVLTPVDGKLTGIFPAETGGLYAYDLTQPGAPEPRQIFDRPGQIRGVAFFADYLWVGGAGNPLDAYRAPVTDSLELAFTMISAMKNVADIILVDTTLHVLYPDLGWAMEWGIDSIGLHIFGSTLLIDTVAKRILPTTTVIDGQRVILGINDRSISVYSVGPSEGHPHVTQFWGRVSIGYPISAVTYDDYFLYVAHAKGLSVYQLFDDFVFEFRSRLTFSGEVTCLLPWKGRLLAFMGNKMLVYDMTNAFFPRLVEERLIPMPVSDVAIDGAFLYTVGPLGTAVYDSRPALPRLVDFGGRGGTHITARDGEVVISDGTSLHVYELHYVPTEIGDPPEHLPSGFALEQNYPNPFNPSTTILFSLPRQTEIRLVVFNILGQEVATLAEGTFPAGQHRIEWPGTNREGRSVASGVYLYRLDTEHYRASRKMILVR